MIGKAINRFAGSDVDYFINFEHYFPMDYINIPLATNYRSPRRIVEHANTYMLTHYDSTAMPARAHSTKRGKIKILNPKRIKFDTKDLAEDALGDARYLSALAQASGLAPTKVSPAAGKLLKQLYKICRRHHRQDIMLLHRHNYTSFHNLSLEQLQLALKILLDQEQILSSADYSQQIRCMTMHKSKGLEATVVILLEVNHDIIYGSHPHATLFSLFGDSLAAERADQQRLMYVALTRAKKYLYVLSTDQDPKC